MKKKMIMSICITLAIIITVTACTTYAYLYASATASGRIEGEIESFDATLSLTDIYKATKLVPLSNDLVDDAIKKTSNKCIDKNGYEVCSLFRLTLANTGNAVNLNGYVTTVSSDYITNNLKYQIFDSNYTAVSDVMTLSSSANTMVYFTKNSNKINVNLASSNITYYLAVWLTETGSSQTSDYSKNFSGKVGFESLVGNVLEASFDT